MTAAVSVSGLDLWYGKKQILRNVSFSVEEGEFFLVIGPNGSGKTSLLKAIAGLTTPAAGAIKVLGLCRTQWSRKEFSRRVAVVSQHVPDDFPFRVAETVLMGRSPHLGLWEAEKAEDRRLAEEAMKFTDLAHLADRRLDELSGGERQLVFIARAICQSPRVLILDEPTASLDPAHQIRILDLVEDLRSRQKVTVIMVSHDLNMAALYGHRLLLLADGEVAGLGSPQEVLTWQQLERIYGCLMLVDESTLGKAPRVTPVPEKYQLGGDRQNPEARIQKPE